MTLQEYMDKKGIKDAEIAEAIGKDRTLVSKYRRGLVLPPLDVIKKIDEFTNRQVSFRDFAEVA